jgi:hypothetical protein
LIFTSSFVSERQCQEFKKDTSRTSDQETKQQKVFTISFIFEKIIMKIRAELQEKMPVQTY